MDVQWNGVMSCSRKSIFGVMVAHWLVEAMERLLSAYPGRTAETLLEPAK